MKHLRTGIIAAACLLVASCSGQQAARLESEQQPIPHASAELAPETSGSRYIVCLKDGTTDQQRDALAAALSTAPDVVYTAVFKGFAGPLTASEVAAIQADPLVASIERDIVVSIPDGIQPDSGDLLGDLPGAGSLLPPSDSGARTASATQVVDWGVTRIGADVSTSRGNGIVVAVLDTGCDMQHPDLFQAYIQSGGRLVSHNMIYPTRPADDGHGHGTHCAGIIGARDNSYGTRGVAPNCKIIPVKVLSDTGGGLNSWVVGGIDWCVANRALYGIKVLSMSLGGGGFVPGTAGLSPATEAAVNSATTAGMMVVAAAGNDYLPVNAGIDNNNNGTWEPGIGEQRVYFTPAYVPNVICVSALDGRVSGGVWTQDCFAVYSNCGSTLHVGNRFYMRDIDLIAPGSAIYSTYRKGRYATLSGTSMACPHVAGACALWLQNNPGHNRNQVLSGLISMGFAGPAGGWPTVPGQGRPDPDGTGEPLLQVGTL